MRMEDFGVKIFFNNKIMCAIRKASAKHLLLPVFSIAAAIVLFVILPFNDIFNMKTASTSSDALKLYKEGYEYATINLSTLRYTGYDVMVGKEVKASYYYDIVNEKCTFYLLDSELVKNRDLEIKNISIKVKFEEPDGVFDNMLVSFANSLGWTTQGLTNITVPVIMNQEEYNEDIYVVLYIVLVLVIAYSSALITINLLFILFPMLHTSWLTTYSYSIIRGMKKTISEVLNELDELVIVQAGDMYITEKYFINLGKNETSIMPLSKIVFAYEHAKLRSIFGIHLKVTHTLNLRGLEFKRVIATGKEATDMSVIIDYLKAEYPDIIWGHTKENRKMARKIMLKERREKRERRRKS